MQSETASHPAGGALDAADLDGDGNVEVACVRRDELLLVDGRTGVIKNAVPVPADNGQIVRKTRNHLIMQHSGLAATGSHKMPKVCSTEDPRAGLAPRAFNR